MQSNIFSTQNTITFIGTASSILKGVNRSLINSIFSNWKAQVVIKSYDRLSELIEITQYYNAISSTVKGAIDKSEELQQNNTDKEINDFITQISDRFAQIIHEKISNFVYQTGMDIYSVAKTKSQQDKLETYNRFVETNPQLAMEQAFEGYRTRVAAAAVKNLGNNVKSDEATYLLLALYSDQVIQINDKHNQHLAKLYKERVDLHGSARRKKDQEIEQYKKDHELNEREESGRLFSKTVDLDSYMDDQGNIKWHEIPQEKLDSIVSKQNIRLKIRVNDDGSQHAMVGIRTEDGDIDYGSLDALIQDKLKSKGIKGDNRCVLRSIMANGKYDELRNGGKSHEEALNEAAEYSTSSRELKKYTNGIKTWTKVY